MLVNTHACVPVQNQNQALYEEAEWRQVQILKERLHHTKEIKTLELIKACTPPFIQRWEEPLPNKER